ncbi:Dna replication complex gins sld5 [Quillaja saponaria]|uniref:Dna replication complex gins sld5 n=1 Tax=Quillaja saponaria TaxID=32244 RepID=A0AAD7P752_QUISA|nr:Dna replication complex gins sld5 [Quillaja saponaria]
MDNNFSKTPSKELSEEQAREILIAISNSQPDKVPDLDFASEFKSVDGIVMSNGTIWLWSKAVQNAI